MHLKASELGSELVIEADVMLPALTIRIVGKLRIGQLTITSDTPESEWPYLEIGDSALPGHPLSEQRQWSTP